jgi:hypothetical protein
MATNPPPGKGRVGAVKNRVQVYSSQNKRWTKVNKSKKSRFMDQYFKKDIPFKGVIKKRKGQKKKRK